MGKKEPWQMTIAEYIQSLKGIKIQRSKHYSRFGQLSTEHQNAVAIAIQLGKNIPKKVVLEFRRESPSTAHQLLNIPQGKYAPKVARYKLPGR